MKLNLKHQPEILMDAAVKRTASKAAGDCVLCSAKIRGWAAVAMTA